MYKIKFRTIRFIIISYFVLIFQATLISDISIGFSRPELVLLLVIFYSLYNGAKNGMICGLILGFCLDTLSGGIVGINSFILGCVGLSCGFLKERVYTSHILTRILTSALGCFFSIACYYFLASHFYLLPDFFENLGFILRVVIYTTLFNLVFSRFLERSVVVRTTSLS